MSIEKALIELLKLFKKWNIGPDDWCVIGEWALILQGWDVPERKSILDVYVDRDKLPWPSKGERQAIPPKDSTEFKDWVDFTEKTGFGLDIAPLPYGPFKREDIKQGSVVYKLSENRNIRIHTPLAEISAHQLMFREFTEVDVGKENIERWWKYVRDIKKAARERDDKEVMNAAILLLKKYGKE